MPTQFFVATPVTGDAGVEVAHCAAGVDVVARLKPKSPKRADAYLCLPADPDSELIASRVQRFGFAGRRGLPVTDFGPV